MSDNKIPSLDRKGIANVFSQMENVGELMSPHFHQFLLDSWEELGKPAMFEVNFPFGSIIFVADMDIGKQVIRDIGRPRENPYVPAELGIAEKSYWMQSIGGKEGPAGEYSVFAMSSTKEYGATADQRGFTYKEIQSRLIRAFSRSALARYGEIMVDDSDEFVTSLPVDGSTFDLVPEIDRLVLNSATRTLMSVEFHPGEDTERLNYFLRDGAKASTIKALVHPIMFSLLQKSKKLSTLIPDYKRYLQEKDWVYNNIVMGIVDSKLAKITSPEEYTPIDMLDHLIVSLLTAQTDERVPVGELPRFTNDTIKQILLSEVATFMIAGQETSASQEISILAFLLDPANAHILAQVKAELAANVGAGMAVNHEDIAGLKMLKAVMDFCLLKYPATFIIPRELTAANQLGGIDLPAGQQIFPSPLLMNRNLIPELELNDPTIFIEPNADLKARIDSNSTFGQGLRACLGKNFAEQEMMIHLANIVSRCDFELVEAGPGASGVVPYRGADSLLVKATLVR